MCARVRACSCVFMIDRSARLELKMCLFADMKVLDCLGFLCFGAGSIFIVILL